MWRRWSNPFNDGYLKFHSAILILDPRWNYWWKEGYFQKRIGLHWALELGRRRKRRFHKINQSWLKILIPLSRLVLIVGRVLLESLYFHCVFFILLFIHIINIRFNTVVVTVLLCRRNDNWRAWIYCLPCTALRT